LRRDGIPLEIVAERRRGGAVAGNRARMGAVKPLRELIHESHVHDLGPLPAPRLEGTATVQQALQFLVRGRRGAIVIVDGSTPVGILTERDVLYGTAAANDVRRALVRDVMSRPVKTVRRQQSLIEAIRVMVGQRCRHLVVVDSNGHLRGLLTTNDLMQFVTERFPEDLVNLPPRLHQRYLSPEGA